MLSPSDGYLDWLRGKSEKVRSFNPIQYARYRKKFDTNIQK